MISWQAYAPRRARDPIAWLRGKGITTREGLHSALSELKIDVSTFPQDVADSYLRSLEATVEEPPIETMAEALKVDPAAPSPLQDDVRRSSKRVGKAPPS